MNFRAKYLRWSCLVIRYFFTLKEVMKSKDARHCFADGILSQTLRGAISASSTINHRASRGKEDQCGLQLLIGPNHSRVISTSRLSALINCPTSRSHRADFYFFAFVSFLNKSSRWNDRYMLLVILSIYPMISQISNDRRNVIIVAFTTIIVIIF